MEIHIGQLIKSKIEVIGISKNEFARRIHVTPQNVFDIFKRKSIDTQLLKKISEVLNHDFFRLYSYSYKEEVEKLREENKLLKELMSKYK